MDDKSINFIDYDKISDDLLFFDKYFVLRFNLKLSKRRMESSQRNYFTREYAYPSSYATRKNDYSIRRSMSFYYSINHVKDFQNGVMLMMNDVVVLKILLDSQIMPWYIGKKRIYGESPDDHLLVIKGKWSEVTMALSERSYLAFSPIIIEYEDGKRIEGIRICINAPDNYVDTDITKFMQFYYIICNTNMYEAAIGLANFVPQMDGSTMSEQNNYNAEDVDWSRNRSNVGKGFFDNK